MNFTKAAAAFLLTMTSSLSSAWAGEPVWNAIIGKGYTDAITPDLCRMPWILTVSRDGSFIGSPCKKGEEPRYGQLQARELSRLIQAALPYNYETATSEPSFEEFKPWPTEVDLQFGDETYFILDANARNTRYRGTSREAWTLQETIVPLTYKYVARR